MLGCILNENVYMECIMNGKLENAQSEHNVRLPSYSIFIKF